MARKTKTRDVIELVISGPKLKDGTFPESPNAKKQEKIVKLHRRDFYKKAWDVMSRSAGLNDVFNRGFRLFGGYCNPEFDGCGANAEVRVAADHVGPEVVHIVYECLKCGRQNSDVAD